MEHGIKAPLNYKNFLLSYFCTDISVNLTQESLVFQLSVAKNRISLSSIQPILGKCMYQKGVFSAKKAVHCSGALLKKLKRVLSYFLNGYRYHTNFNRFEFQALKAIFSINVNKC